MATNPLMHLFAQTLDALANAKAKAAKQRMKRSLATPAILRNLGALSRFTRGSVERDYRVDHNRVLGTGCSGAVVTGICLQSGREVAIKSYRKLTKSTRQLEALQSEIHVHLSAQHEHIAELLHVYEDNEMLSFVIQLCSGKELFARLSESVVFTETQARRATQQMCAAISHLHRNGIAHRDLKLENWLYESEISDAPLRLIDFGFAYKCGQTDEMSQRCGTLPYMAPEVFAGSYSKTCDMWSLGVIVYTLLDGHFPFRAKTEAELQAKIQARDFTFPRERWGAISESAHDFVRRLLTLSSADRMSAEQCLQHPWLQNPATCLSSPARNNSTMLTGALGTCPSDGLKNSDDMLSRRSTAAS